MENKVKEIYIDLLDGFIADYATMKMIVASNGDVTELVGSMSATESMIKRLEKEFPTICNCPYTWIMENWRKNINY